MCLWKKSTLSARLEAKDLHGVTGDPWTPVNKTEHKALTIDSSGFHYRRLQEILFGGDYERGACQLPQDGDPDEGVCIRATALARGQGQTNGLHERTVQVPRARSILKLGPERERAAARSNQRVKDVATVRAKALRPALLTLLQGARENPDWTDERPGKWLQDFQRRVDSAFFPLLWKSMNMSDEDAQRDWHEELRGLGWSVLLAAEKSLPVPGARRYRALAVAERIYVGAILNNFPELMDRKEA